MVAVRIIPCLDVHKGRVVKGINFVNLRDAGDPVEQAILYDAEGADELCFLNINATMEDKNKMYNVICRTADNVSLPLIVGGGVGTIDDFQKLLICGADRIAINTQAIQAPQIIAKAAQRFGSQCVVVAIDVKTIKGQWKVFSHGGHKKTSWQALDWAKKVELLGAGEILLTSMDRDGTRQGFDIDLLLAMRRKVNIPIIASGGVGKYNHFIEGITLGKANAVLAASVFHFGTHNIIETKRRMIEAGIKVRPVCKSNRKNSKDA